jgi:hypothetical protein
MLSFFDMYWTVKNINKSIIATFKLFYETDVFHDKLYS